jgi:hypothetical protein
VMRRQGVTNERTPWSGVRMASDGTAEGFAFRPINFQFEFGYAVYQENYFCKTKWAEGSDANLKERRMR